MFSIQHRSAMKAFSLGRNSGLMVSAPGASQSMSASAHWRSLIFASMVSISMATGSSFRFGRVSVHVRAGCQASRAGVRLRGKALHVPADLGVELRHAVQLATVMGVQADSRHFLRRESDPARQPVGEFAGLL